MFCSVFGTRDFHFLQPGYPPFEVDQIDVRPMALQPSHRTLRKTRQKTKSNSWDGFTLELPGVTHGLILREHNHDILMVWFYVSSFTRTFSLQYTQVRLL